MKNIRFWIILGILGFIMLSDEKPKKKGISKAPIDLQGLNLAGRIRSCDAWFESVDKNGNKIHRCFIYAPSCNTKKCKTDPKLIFSGITATCKRWEKRPDGSRYCAEYAPTCGAETEGCRKEPAPIPGKAPKKTKKQIKEEIEKEQKAQERIVEGMAKMLASEANEKLDQNKQLMRKILDHGGIAPYKSGYLSEEYRDIPTKYKRKDGIPIDELAQELGTNEAQLADEINQAERSFLVLKEKRGGKTARRFKKDDFINEAWDRMATGRGLMGWQDYHYKSFDSPVDVSYAKKLIQSALAKNISQKSPFQIQTLMRKLRDEEQRLINYGFAGKSIMGDFLYTNLDYAIRYLGQFYGKVQKSEEKQMTLFGYRKKIHGEDFFSPKQKELFPELRREMVLQIDDPATSDDPLIACLERQGWDAKKVTKLQDSIAEKLTIDMFGKVKKLTGTEIMLQESIDKCFERLRK